MDYQKIDRNTWARGELFAFYIDRMRVVMSLTVDIDAAPLAAFAKRNGLKFYPAMIWTVSSVINRPESPAQQITEFLSTSLLSLMDYLDP